VRGGEGSWASEGIYTFRPGTRTRPTTFGPPSAKLHRRLLPLPLPLARQGRQGHEMGESGGTGHDDDMMLARRATSDLNGVGIPKLFMLVVDQ